jgi:hypothetical protein
LCNCAAECGADGGHERRRVELALKARLVGRQETTVVHVTVQVSTLFDLYKRDADRPTFMLDSKWLGRRRSWQNRLSPLDRRL